MGTIFIIVAMLCLMSAITSMYHTNITSNMKRSIQWVGVSLVMYVIMLIIYAS